MSSKANRLAERAAASRRKTEETPQTSAPEQRRDEPPAARVVNGRKVRTTVVLDPVEYDALADYCRKVERDTGRRGVAGSEVVRVLLGLMREDPDGLGRRVQDEIERNGGNRRR